MSQDEFPLILAAVEESRRKLHFLLPGYVLMPDHWHVLVGVQHPVTISRAIQDIKWISARRVNHRRQTLGSVWQHQFWDRFIRHEKEFSERLNYLHLNPVRKGLAEHPGKWIWSSYNNYALDPLVRSQCPIQIDCVCLPARW